MDHHDMIKFFLDALEVPVKELNTWEEDFLESIREQFEKRGTLTDNQYRKLEDIYNEKG